METMVDRFWSKVAKQAEGCWLWTGERKHRNGPGVAYVYGKVLAHRFAWMTSNRADVPEGKCVVRTCGERLCVRPDHLRLADTDETHRLAGEAVRVLTDAQLARAQRLRRKGKTAEKIAAALGVPEHVGTIYAATKQTRKRRRARLASEAVRLRKAGASVDEITALTLMPRRLAATAVKGLSCIDAAPRTDGRRQQMRAIVEAGLSRQDAAEQFGVSYATIRAVARGLPRKPPSNKAPDDARIAARELRSQGLKREEIAKRLGKSVRWVSYTTKDA